MIYDKKRYKIFLTPQTPLFIGSGKRLMKREYVYSEKENEIYILNPQKFFYFLREMNLLGEYEEYMKNDSNVKLSQWLEDNKIEINQNQPWIDYTVKPNGNKSFHESEIHCFIKNGYGKPYIPGSSLKGALRTAILVNLLLNQKSLNVSKKEYLELQQANFEKCKTFISNVEEKSSKTEQKVLNQLHKNSKINSALKDFMRAIRIYDSAPVEEGCLSLCKKVDISYHQGEKKVNEINMLRESITSQKPIELEMTIDDKLLNQVLFLSDYSSDYAEFIRKSIEQYSQAITQYFVRHFSDAVKPEKNVIYLGGGTGFASKTILPSLLGDESARNVISKLLHDQFPKNHKHDVLDLNVSPHTIKCTRQSGDLEVQFGMCKIEIVRI